jgi:predicted RNA-binding Zn-ribbon protein involved in translation (DUF1610 family)
MSEKRVPPSMQALVLASKLELKENTSGSFECPQCADTFVAYRGANGKLGGKCENCGLAVPRF